MTEPDQTDSGTDEGVAVSLAKTERSSFRGWVITLLLTIILIQAWPLINGYYQEGKCGRENGRIMTQTLTGRQFCDFWPWVDGIGDMQGKDFWID